MINNYNYQSKENISCLFEDVKYKERKDALLLIAKEFSTYEIHWSVACSMNLFLRGVVDEFHDLDLVVDGKDINKIVQIMEDNGAILIETGGNGFCESDTYMHFQLGRVDIDIISGFRIITFGTRFVYQFNNKELDFTEKLTEYKIPMLTMEALYLLYSMMEGWQPKRRYKRILIEEYLLYERPKFPEILERALEEALPGWIKTNIEGILS